MRKLKYDPKSPWCTIDKPRRGTVTAVRIVGSNRNPGAGRSAYLHIEGQHGSQQVRLYFSGRAALRNLRDMLNHALDDS